MHTHANAASNKLLPPKQMGSYSPEDVQFLLKDVSEMKLEQTTEDREEAIQGGKHYSEMLPQEYKPTAAYMKLFHETLDVSARAIALAAGIVSELVLRKRGSRLVLASLARGGTPAGILMKRYIKQIHQVELPHYSLSIIRGKGIDENAVLYMVQQHPDHSIQFVDGWTGKGAISEVLIEACERLSKQYGITLSSELAVLADPGRCSSTYGTREDFLIPSACLNATVSGLISRTVLRDDLIGPHDYHGAKYYREWMKEDVSSYFVDTISAYFDEIYEEAQAEAGRLLSGGALEADWSGLQTVRRIQQDYGIQDVNLVKPGVGETTRVLLRRVPWKILVDRLDNPNLRHILMLAEEKQVPVEVYEGLTYSCCGLIKPLHATKGGRSDDIRE